MKTTITSGILAGFILGCAPAETIDQVDPPSSTTPNDNNASAGNPTIEPQAPAETSKDPEQAVTKMMYMERRDSSGNIVGLLEEGLWFKQGDEAPYTGLVVGMNKPKKDGSPPDFPYNYSREFKDGVQIGTETGWYATGKKRIELIYENGEVVSMKQWDADGNELNN